MAYQHISFLRRIAATLVFTSLTAAVGVAAADDAAAGKSRVLAQQFGAQLKSELEAAMVEGGPLAALDVCKDRAPQIASELSRQSGAKVTRVSRRYRNPAAAPEPWQLAVLQDFDTADESLLPEHVERSAGGLRYMKAIRTQPLCLVCHGETLTEDVRSTLDVLYPHDRARGYALGDLRGAFSISWPAQRETSQRDE